MADANLRVLAEVVGEWERAPWGKRGEMLARRLPLLGMSEGTFHRQRLKFFGETKTRPGPLGRKKPEYEPAVKAIMQLKYSRIKGVRALTTEDAMVLAAEAGVALAADIPEGTVNRIARELRLHPKVQRRENRFEAARPNEWHQMDASRSEYFQCHRLVAGEWVLKLSPTPFKNRDVRDSRERLWIYGLVDDFSGYRVARYVIAKGENALDGIAFLQWAWSKTEAHTPFRGLPDHLYLDKGPLDKSKAFKEFCREVAGVELHSHEAGRPQATGKVETGWKDLWRRFEAKFFRERAWEGREMSLTELNQELCWYLRDHHNRRNHRRLKLTKEEAWLTVTGVVDIAPEAWRHIFHREARTLDAAGCFDFRGAAYQVGRMPYPGGVRVMVHLGVRDGALLVVDPRDGKKYGAGPFAPMPAGEFRAGERTPLERLLEEQPAASSRQPVSFRPQEEGNVLHLVRTSEQRAVSSEQLAVSSEQLTEDRSLKDLAQGITLVERPGTGDRGPEEPIYESDVARYGGLLVRRARGEELSPENTAWMARVVEESRGVRLLKDDLERRARLSVISNQ